MVLVTGATGFVGSHLVLHLLENEEDVRAIYLNLESITKTKSLFLLYNKSYLFDKIHWMQADITDVCSLEIAFQNITQVYHCAALLTFEPKKEAFLRKINIEGTANIVNHCLDFRVSKLCYVSSIAALGDLMDFETVITEDTDWNAEKYHSDYAISKYGGEMEIWRGQQEGLNAVIVNPGVIIGAGFWEDGSGKIFSTVKKGIRFYTKGSSGFVGINDVVKCMFLLMKSDAKSERYTIVAENLIFEDLTKKIAENLNVKLPKIYARKWMTEIVWRLDWLFSKLFFAKRNLSRAIAKSLHTKDFYSNEKIKKQLHFEFQSVADCVEETANFFNNVQSKGTRIEDN